MLRYVSTSSQKSRFSNAYSAVQNSRKYFRQILLRSALRKSLSRMATELMSAERSDSLLENCERSDVEAAMGLPYW